MCDGSANSNGNCVCPVNQAVVESQGGTLTCSACGAGYYRDADEAPVSSAKNCSLRLCGFTGKYRSCGCGSNQAVATDGKTLKCTACVSGFVRSADVAPVSTAQHCVVRQCNGSGRNCGCGSNEAVIDDGRTLTCSNCATYYGRAADVVPVSTAQNCTVKRCNGKGLHCGCGSNEAVQKHNGTMLSCAVCDPGYERAADTAPVSIAQDCTIQQCDGTNSICGCPANHAVRFLTGYISGLVCKPCSVGYQRSVDTVPVTSEQECTVKLCTGPSASGSPPLIAAPRTTSAGVIAAM